MIFLPHDVNARQQSDGAVMLKDIPAFVSSIRNIQMKVSKYFAYLVICWNLLNWTLPLSSVQTLTEGEARL